MLLGLVVGGISRLTSPWSGPRTKKPSKPHVRGLTRPKRWFGNTGHPSELPPSDAKSLFPNNYYLAAILRSNVFQVKNDVAT